MPTGWRIASLRPLHRGTTPFGCGIPKHIQYLSIVTYEGPITIEQRLSATSIKAKDLDSRPKRGIQRTVCRPLSKYVCDTQGWLAASETSILDLGVCYQLLDELFSLDVALIFQHGGHDQLERPRLDEIRFVYFLSASRGVVQLRFVEHFKAVFAI
jgi:hypothetical protein